MIEWLRFALIVFITVIDHILHEVVLSFTTTRDFVRYRLQFIVRDKLRTMRVWRSR